MDFVYLAGIAVFGALILGFIIGCDRLGSRSWARFIWPSARSRSRSASTSFTRWSAPRSS